MPSMMEDTTIILYKFFFEVDMLLETMSTIELLMHLKAEHLHVVVMTLKVTYVLFSIIGIM